MSNKQIREAALALLIEHNAGIHHERSFPWGELEKALNEHKPKEKRCKWRFVRFEGGNHYVTCESLGFYEGYPETCHHCGKKVKVVGG